MAQHPATGGVAAVGPPLAYAVVIERGPHNYSAYAPDVLGCVATGQTVEEVTARFREALTEHLALLREYGEPIPAPRTRLATVEITIPQAATG